MTGGKVIISGNFGVGKTSLFNKFVFNTFSDKYLTTIGVKVNKKVVTVQDTDVSLMIWDVAGEVNQDKIPTSYFFGAACIIYVIDLFRPETFKRMDEDLEYLSNLVPNCQIKVVGNKVDLFTKEALIDRLTQVSTPINFLTSAKTGENVEELFTEIANEFIY